MRTIVGTLIAASVAAVFSPHALAHPIIVEDYATLTSPDPVAWPAYGEAVATNGEYALVLGSRDDHTANSGNGAHYRAGLLYRRSAGQWTLQRTLAETERGSDSYIFPNQFAMRGGPAVAELDGRFFAYRLTAGVWQPTPFNA